MSVVLKSFAELAEVLDLGEPVDEVAPKPQPACNVAADTCSPVPDLQQLLAELQRASASLATISRRDQETRAVAFRDLERYDALVVRQHEAEAAHDRACQVRAEAEKLVESAFAEQARAEVIRVLEIVRRAEDTAGQVAEQWRREADALAAQLDLQRLLAERRRQEEVEKAKAAAAEKARRLAGTLAQARAALDAGRFGEAKGLLGPLAKDNPDNLEINSLKTIIAQRELGVKIDAVEEVLWQVRRTCRRDPEAAVARLEVLDVDGLPEPLARHLFGEWARACARLCREQGCIEPLRYAPDPGRGAVLAREQPDGGYVVVSSLGMGAGWQKGSPVGERQIRRARPLR